MAHPLSTEARPVSAALASSPALPPHFCVDLFFLASGDTLILFMMGRLWILVYVEQRILSIGVMLMENTMTFIDLYREDVLRVCGFMPVKTKGGMIVVKKLVLEL